jgi:hypothetical protein
MEEFKSWEEMSDLEQAQCTYWDIYKDAYGVRPRGVDTSTWTLADFNAEFELLGEIIKQENTARQLAQHEAAHAFEQRVLKIIACGANGREMALRWIHEAEGSNGDDEFLCYLMGLPYRYFAQVA